jgi:hypothetical protein
MAAIVLTGITDISMARHPIGHYVRRVLPTRYLVVAVILSFQLGVKGRQTPHPLQQNMYFDTSAEGDVVMSLCGIVKPRFTV